MSGFIHFVLGGSRSGKSRRAESLAIASGQPVAYIATYAADPSDREMQLRVERHRQQRPSNWKTIENRIDLENVMAETAGVLFLIDCLTLWLSFHLTSGRSADQILRELEQTMLRVRKLERSLIIVSNEVGAGLVPMTPEGRAFRDLCGTANQLVAAHASIVELIVAGLPLVLKGGVNAAAR
ncbi:MAG: bifunctional adenosylcobinamide kinase/adenosylcobinamide-phosphate guanylyltransferase [Verrucomicrobia bacterium]|nr:bifunctional adenosylcobinamide kinase/adenosylcobinamide-phosphate guanylyltransferase [Verrucomicrobiota bacterium]